jgi:hypothetical protein
VGATYAVGSDMSYYRFTLPLPLGANPAQAGTWYALLEVDEEIFRRLAQKSDRTFAAGLAQMAHGIRYNVSAQAYSNLRMEAGLSQNSLQPGATLTVRAALFEYGIPVEDRASVLAEVERPDSSSTTLALVEVEPGVFENSAPAGIQGVYRIRVLATGVTIRGLSFTREQLLSGAVVLGGDNPSPATGPSTHARDKQLCELMECLLGSDVLGRFLIEHKVDPNYVHRCIEHWCKARMGGLTEEEIHEREGTSG